MYVPEAAVPSRHVGTAAATSEPEQSRGLEDTVAGDELGGLEQIYTANNGPARDIRRC